MKKRINTIKDKILVQGGTDNELKNHEIRLNSDFSLSERVNGSVRRLGVGGGQGGAAGKALYPVTAEIFNSFEVQGDSNLSLVASDIENGIQIEVNILNGEQMQLESPISFLVFIPANVSISNVRPFGMAGSGMLCFLKHGTIDGEKYICFELSGTMVRKGSSFIQVSMYTDEKL